MPWGTKHQSRWGMKPWHPHARSTDHPCPELWHTRAQRPNPLGAWSSDTPVHGAHIPRCTELWHRGAWSRGTPMHRAPSPQRMVPCYPRAWSSGTLVQGAQLSPTHSVPAPQSREPWYLDAQCPDTCSAGCSVPRCTEAGCPCCTEPGRPSVRSPSFPSDRCSGTWSVWSRIAQAHGALGHCLAPAIFRK